MKKLSLNKQAITELSSKEMENIEGGKGWWSDFRTGNCKYSQTEEYAETVCIQVTSNNVTSYHTMTVSCVNS